MQRTLLVKSSQNSTLRAGGGQRPDYLTKEDTQMTSILKDAPHRASSGKCKSKTTVRHHYIRTIKNPKHCKYQTQVRVWSNRTSLLMLVRMQKWYHHFQRQSGSFLQEQTDSQQSCSLLFTQRSWKFMFTQKLTHGCL